MSANIAGASGRSTLLHAALESSEPAAGDTLTAYPAVIRLVFSEPVEHEFSVLTLTDGTGTVTKLIPRVDPRNTYALIADFPRLPAGSYLVTWRIVSADGHPVGGYFPFYAAVGPGGRTAAQILQGTKPAPEPPREDLAGSPAGTSGEPPILSAIVRGAAEAILLAFTGLLALLTWGIPARQGRLSRLETILAIAGPLVLAADFLLWLQHAAPDGAVNLDTMIAALSTQNGAGYALRVAFAVAAAWALLLARSPAVAAVFGALALVATGATGHPAAIRPAIAIPAKIVHLTAASLWTGGIMILAFGDRAGEEFRRDAWRVSRIALASVSAVALTGAVETLLFLPHLRDLVGSTYGWLVMGKLAGLGVLVAFGARNRYALIPKLDTGAGPGALRRSVAWETGWMAAVVVLAAFLAYIPPPAQPGVGMSMPGHHMMPGQTMPAPSESEP